METFKLDDSTIAHVAKLIQLAILSGTDVVDHLRMIRLTSDDDDTLYLDATYAKNSEKNIQTMLTEIDRMTEATKHG